MLPRARRLPKELTRSVLARGRTVASQNASLKFMSGEPNSPSRFTFVVSGKAVKRAVDRNLLKRRGRHIVRKHEKEIRPSHLIIVFIKPTLLEQSFAQMEDEIVFLLQKAKII